MRGTGQKQRQTLHISAEVPVAMAAVNTFGVVKSCVQSMRVILAINRDFSASLVAWLGCLHCRGPDCICSLKRTKHDSCNAT
jgi:hypothetical protein